MQECGVRGAVVGAAVVIALPNRASTSCWSLILGELEFGGSYGAMLRFYFGPGNVTNDSPHKIEPFPGKERTYIYSVLDRSNGISHFPVLPRALSGSFVDALELSLPFPVS